METPVTLDEWRAKVSDLEDQVKSMDAEFAGKRFDEGSRERYSLLMDERQEAVKAVMELEIRSEQIASFGREEEKTEQGATFYTNAGSTKGGDIYDTSTIQRSWDNPEAEVAELRDRSLRAIEGARFAHPALDHEEAQGHLENLVEGTYGDTGGQVSRYLLATGSPAYKRAFTKKMQGAPRSTEEEGLLYRAMSLSGASGGVAVPFVLDPTLLPSYNGAVNPYRNIANVQTIAVDEWRGVTSGGITAAFQAEAAATTDQSPTLASVSVSTEMARVAIPYSIEIGMDWGSFASDMAQEIQNAKDVLEASKFAVGTGTNEPFGVVVGATTVFTASATNALFVADVYGVHDALPPLYRSRAAWTLNNATLSKIRQLDTAGGSGMLTPNLQVRSAANVGSPAGPDMTDSRANVDIFGKPVHEASGQSGTFTTGQLIGVVGAFSSYFKIIDRIGLSIVDAGYAQDATSGLPTGQKFMLAYWRVGSKVLAANAFRTLKLA